MIRLADPRDARGPSPQPATLSPGGDVQSPEIADRLSARTVRLPGWSWLRGASGGGQHELAGRPHHAGETDAAECLRRVLHPVQPVILSFACTSSWPPKHPCRRTGNL